MHNRWRDIEVGSYKSKKYKYHLKGFAPCGEVSEIDGNPHSMRQEIMKEHHDILSLGMKVYIEQWTTSNEHLMVQYLG